MVMTDLIRIIPHSQKGIPDTGSFEVRFPDGRPSKYFYWDDNRGRAVITRNMSQDQASCGHRCEDRASFAR